MRDCNLPMISDHAGPQLWYTCQRRIEISPGAILKTLNILIFRGLIEFWSGIPLPAGRSTGQVFIAFRAQFLCQKAKYRLMIGLFDGVMLVLLAFRRFSRIDGYVNASGCINR